MNDYKTRSERTEVTRTYPAEIRNASHGLNIYIDDMMIQVHVNDEDFKQGQDMARLIAAARELLDALSRIMSYANTGAHACDIDVNEQPEFVNARAAIAKAGGK